MSSPGDGSRAKRMRSGSAKIVAVLVQSVVVQICGLAFFYLLSIRLSPADFGLLSWANAISLFLGTIAGFGLEQVVLRRVAAGNATSAWAASALFLHSLLLSLLILGILFAVRAVFGAGHPGLQLLPVWFAVQGLSLLVVPLKSILNARARYMPYALIALGSNLGRILSLAWLLSRGAALGLGLAAGLMLLFTALEFAATALYIWRSPHRPPLKVPRRAYRGLLREAAPQYLSVLFDISLARADWILLGILSTDAATGYYSFSYRAFEMLRVPAVGIGLLLMPWMAPRLGRSGQLDEAQMQPVNAFFRLEMAVIMLVVLLLNLSWTPVVGSLTNGRYGAVNATETLLLSCCLPLQYSVNLFWMLLFSARRYKELARITLVSSMLNLSANAVLIPLSGSRGAAIAFLLAALVQTGLYIRLMRRSGMRADLRPLLICGAVAAATMSVAPLAGPRLPLYAQLGTAAALYLLVTFALRQWRPSDLRTIRPLLSR